MPLILKKKKEELAKLCALPGPDSAMFLNSHMCMGLICLSRVKHTLNMSCWILKPDAQYFLRNYVLHSHLSRWH